MNPEQRETRTPIRGSHRNAVWKKYASRGIAAKTERAKLGEGCQFITKTPAQTKNSNSRNPPETGTPRAEKMNEHAINAAKTKLTAPPGTKENCNMHAMMKITAPAQNRKFIFVISASRLSFDKDGLHAVDIVGNIDGRFFKKVVRRDTHIVHLADRKAVRKAGVGGDNNIPFFD